MQHQNLKVQRLRGFNGFTRPDEIAHTIETMFSELKDPGLSYRFGMTPMVMMLMQRSLAKNGRV